MKVVATVYDLFKNFMDGLGLAWTIDIIYTFYPDHNPFYDFLGRGRT